MLAAEISLYCLDAVNNTIAAAASNSTHARKGYKVGNGWMKAWIEGVIYRNSCPGTGYCFHIAFVPHINLYGTPMITRSAEPCAIVFPTNDVSREPAMVWRSAHGSGIKHTAVSERQSNGARRLETAQNLDGCEIGCGGVDRFTLPA